MLRHRKKQKEFRMSQAAKSEKPYNGAFPLDIVEELEEVKSSSEFKQFSDKLFSRLDTIYGDTRTEPA